MESASHVSKHSALLGWFMRRNGKCKPCVRKINFIGSVHEKEWKVQAMCLRTWFY